MWEYIILGQVPGTQIQVSFETWLLSITGLALITVILLVSRTSHHYHLVAAFRISRVLQTAGYSQWLVTRHHIQA